MEKLDIELSLARQKRYFAQGKTLPLSVRKRALKDLYQAMEEKEDVILHALQEDLGKSVQEAYMCEIGLVKSEISHMIKHISRYARDRIVSTPISLAPGISRIKRTPRGSVLIMSPWNYPILLSFGPLVDALAAGNTVMLKPSAYSPNTTDVISDMIASIFDPEYVTVVSGGREENQSLLECKFDHIFFTGSKAVGREVMSKAAKNLIPVTLELGGKSPCIVDETAKISLAAKRIVFGKFINLGQTCVAPDYIYCHKDVATELQDALKGEIVRQYGNDQLTNLDYGKMINKKHFDRVCDLIDMDKVIIGGGRDEGTLKIEPTIMTGVTFEDAVMQEEIFGPVLPILTYTDIKQVGAKIEEDDLPLALYIFSQNKEHIKYVTEHIRYGGGCINDTIVHLATSSMGFGGVGASGMGAYHGKRGFDTFSHQKSILDRKTFIDVPMRYQPYKKRYENMLRMFVK